MLIESIFSNHSSVTVLGAWLVAVYCWWGVLAMSGQVTNTNKKKVFVWNLFRSAFMGFGIWAFHFVGMLGWRPGINLVFSAKITLLSLLISIASSWPLLQSMRREDSASEAWSNIFIFCAGLSAMHYIGVFAAETEPLVKWNWIWIAFSTLIALVLAIAVLDLSRWINSAQPSERLGRRSLSALLLGSLLFAVHFTSIAGATYVAGTICRTTGTLGGQEMAALVALATTIIFSSTMWLSVTDARSETQLQQEAIELQAKTKLLEQLLKIDTETQLPNRLALEQNFLQETKIIGKISTIFCIELDSYQVILNSWGQEAATEVIKEIANRLRIDFQSAIALARTGETQFTALFSGEFPEPIINQMASKIINSIQTPFGANGLEISLGCRVGISAGDLMLGSNLVSQARSAASFAFHAGLPWCFFQEHMQKDLRIELELQGELRYAISRHELYLTYQPKIDVSTGKITGVEALLRWENTRFGNVSPVKFVPIAEQYALMGKIGDWVLKQGISQIASWHKVGVFLKMSINVSPQQMETDDLVSTVSYLLNEYKVDPKYLILEITESTAMRRPAHTRIQLQKIRSIGVELSIDDFGTGHSGLSYLYKLPVTELKIDRSFVVSFNEGSNIIVEAIIQMVKKFGMRVVAEGIETVEQKDALICLGCDELQGYYYSKPVTAQEIQDFYKKTI